MHTRGLAHTVVAISFLFAAVVALAGDRELVTSRFLLLDQKHDLYTVPDDDRYVAHPVFDCGDHLTAIEVSPKYYYTDFHPEWIEPDSTPAMSATQYETVLSRVDHVKALGNLEREGHIGTSSNMRTVFGDEYRNAIVARTMYDFPAEGSSYKVASFKVDYFRVISGKLERKCISTLVDTAYLIVVDGNTYGTKKAEFEKLVIGDQVSVDALPLGLPRATNSDSDVVCH